MECADCTCFVWFTELTAFVLRNKPKHVVFVMVSGPWEVRFSGMLRSVDFRTTYRISHHLQMGQIGCPEMSLNNVQPKLRNIPEERSHLHRGGSWMKNVNHLDYLGSMITCDVIYRRDIKSSIVVAKAAFTEVRTPFTLHPSRAKNTYV
jgi:hypothetical protein